MAEFRARAWSAKDGENVNSIDREDWVPVDADTTRASAARMYDYFLGGRHNFEVDRVRAEQVLAVAPMARVFPPQNRAFLRRAVNYMLGKGIRQFLDLGSGIPAVGSVHEIAQAGDPNCRVVYVDNEPVAVAHSELILDGNDNAAVIQADLTEPDQVLQHPVARNILSFEEPIGLLMCAVLHFVSDETNPARVVARYHDAMPAGSYLALSHGTSADYPEQLSEVVAIYEETQNKIYYRTRAEVTAMVAGFEYLVWPGVVYMPEWRQDHGSEAVDPAEAIAYAVMGYKSP